MTSSRPWQETPAHEGRYEPVGDWGRAAACKDSTASMEMPRGRGSPASPGYRRHIAAADTDHQAPRTVTPPTVRATSIAQQADIPDADLIETDTTLTPGGLIKSGCTQHYTPPTTNGHTVELEDLLEATDPDEPYTYSGDNG